MGSVVRHYQTKLKMISLAAAGNEIHINDCFVCLYSCEDDVICENGFEWDECLCKGWLHENCLLTYDTIKINLSCVHIVYHNFYSTCYYIHQ